MSYMLTRPEGIASLTLASSPASIPQWVAEANRLREKLPSDVQAALLKHEADGTFEDPEYVAATRDFYRRHVCRLDPYPDFLQRIFDKVGANPEVYDTMNGPSEFHVIGTLSDWDVRNRLDEIDAPTLVTSGRYDEATEVIAGTVHDGIRGSEWVVFEESSHFASRRGAGTLPAGSRRIPRPARLVATQVRQAQGARATARQLGGLPTPLTTSCGVSRQHSS